MTNQDLTHYRREDYRPCVGTMLVNADGLVFVGRRIDNREGDWWQMPQGGVDDGEDIEAALLRELCEETGLRSQHVEIVDRMQNELFYDLPPSLQGKLWGGKYKGQRQRWFLVRFVGEDKDVDLEAYKHPEFCEWKWVEPAQLPQIIVSFKKPIYEAIIEAFAGKF